MPQDQLWYHNSVDQKHFCLIYLHILTYIQKSALRAFRQVNIYFFSLGILFQHIAIKQYYQSMGNTVSRNKCLLLWFLFLFYSFERGNVNSKLCFLGIYTSLQRLRQNSGPKLHHWYHSFGTPFKPTFSFSENNFASFLSVQK